MLALYATMWLSGRWLPSGYPAAATTPQNTITDIFGQALVVGSVVKMLAVVTAINPSDPHFQDVTVTPLYPQSGLVAPQAGVYPQNIPVKSYAFHPLQLMKVGSTL